MSYADDIGSLAGQSGLRDIQACYLGAWTGAWIARYKHRLVMASGTKAGIWDKRMMRNLHPRHGGYPVVEVRLLCSDSRVLRFGSVTIGEENYEFPLAVSLMPPLLRSGPRLSRAFETFASHSTCGSHSTGSCSRHDKAFAPHGREEHNTRTSIILWVYTMVMCHTVKREQTSIYAS